MGFRGFFVILQSVNISWEETFIFECFYIIMTDEFSGLIRENERIFFYVKSTDIY